MRIGSLGQAGADVTPGDHASESEKAKYKRQDRVANLDASFAAVHESGFDNMATLELYGTK
jgi:hypothetical protein